MQTSDVSTISTIFNKFLPGVLTGRDDGFSLLYTEKSIGRWTTKDAGLFSVFAHIGYHPHH